MWVNHNMVLFHSIFWMMMLITKYEMHLLDLWYSGNDNIFYLVVQYNPLLVGMHD